MLNRLALLAVVALAGISHADDRCEQIRKAVVATKDVDTAARALDGTIDGVTMGSKLELGKGKLTSFCVLLDPPLAVDACLKPLGYTKPVVHKALTMDRELWQVANWTPKKGKPLANRMPRLGPVLVGLMLATPLGKRLPNSPAKLPFHHLDRKNDRAIELCLVDARFSR